MDDDEIDDECHPDDCQGCADEGRTRCPWIWYDTEQGDQP